MTMTADERATGEHPDNEQTSAVQAAINIVAGAAGIKASTIQRGNADWGTILEDGLIVTPHVGRTRFKVAVSLEDFGIVPTTEEEELAWKKTLDLGDIYTLPEDERRDASRLEDGYRNATKRYAYETHFGVLIPLGKGDCNRCAAGGLMSLEQHLRDAHADNAELIAALDAEIKRAGDAAAEAESAGLDDEAVIRAGTPNLTVFGRDRGWHFQERLHKAEAIKAEYTALAQRIYDDWSDLMQQMRIQYGSLALGAYERLRQAGKADGQTEQDFVEGFVARRMAAIEDKRESVRESFYMNWTVKLIPLATTLAQDQANAESVLLERDRVRARRSAMYEVERELARTRKEEIKDGMQTLMADVRSHVHGMVYETALGVLEAIQKNGEVPGASVKGMRGLIDKLERLLLVPDEQIEEQIAEVRSMLNVASPSDHTVEIRNTMRRIGAEARLTLYELDRVPQRSGRAVGIPDSLAGLQLVTRGPGRSGQRDLDMSGLSVDIDLSRNGSGRDAAGERSI